MAINASAFHTSASGLNRLPALGSTLIQFNLQEEIARLQEGESWRRTSGRSARTLVKYPDLHVVLILMKADTQLGEHHVDGRIALQLLHGSIRVQIPDQNVDMKSGDLLTLEYGTPHRVESIDESALLTTISWPGGTKDERHSRYLL